MDNVLEILRERGFVKQCTDEEGLSKALSSGSVIYYCGFDPTAESLHVGNLLTVMANAHLQRAGHKPLTLVGGGTAMVGDPSGKTELRKMLTWEQIEKNARGVLSQLQRYLTLDGKAGIPVNNSDWLLDLKYIEFLRDIGRHFRVNEMLRSEAYRMRLEREEGLSFIEFNYQLLQAYDYLVLSRKYGCTLQIGGDDRGQHARGLTLCGGWTARRFALTRPCSPHRAARRWADGPRSCFDAQGCRLTSITVGSTPTTATRSASCAVPSCPWTKCGRWALFGTPTSAR